MMLGYMRELQKVCFPMPNHSKEMQEIRSIHKELKGRLKFGERARLQCLVDKMTALQKIVADDNFTAGFEMGWHIRDEFQDAGIIHSMRKGGD